MKRFLALLFGIVANFDRDHLVRRSRQRQLPARPVQRVGPGNVARRLHRPVWHHARLKLPLQRSLRRRHRVPIPAALVLFATAVGSLGLLGYRRRKLGA